MTAFFALRLENTRIFGVDTFLKNVLNEIKVFYFALFVPGDVLLYEQLYTELFFANKNEFIKIIILSIIQIKHQDKGHFNNQ